MIKITSELDSLAEFKAWSGGKDTLQAVIDAGKIGQLDMIAEEMFPEGCTETELNDWLWFDSDFIFENLGLNKDGEEFPSDMVVEVNVSEEQLEEEGDEYLVDLLSDKMKESQGKSPSYCLMEKIFRNPLKNADGTVRVKFDCTEIEW